MYPARRTVAACWVAALALAAGPVGPAQDAQPAADAPDYWQAIARLDLEAALERAEDDDRRAFVDALAAALAGGSEAAEEPLCALAASTDDALLRRRAGQLALDLLVVEARWEALAGFGERCGLTIPAGTIAPAVLRLPTETVDLPEEPVVLPLVATDSRLPQVEARAAGPEGAARLRALVDTGAGACLLSESAARRLGLTPLGEERLPILGSSGRGADAWPGALRELRLGELVARDLPVLVVRDEALDALVPGVRLVLGWELLQRVVVEIGGAAGELVLRRSSGPAIDVEPNLVLLSEPVVRVRSGAIELLLQLDTGSTVTDATPGLVARLGLEHLPTSEDTTAGIGARREGAVPHVPALPLELGGVTLTIGNVPVWELSGGSRGLLELDGTLGADLALAARLIVDGPARRVDLRGR